MFDWSTLAKMKTKNEPKLASELIYESLFPRKHGKKNLPLKDPSHVDLSHLKHEQVISLFGSRNPQKPRPRRSLKNWLNRSEYVRPPLLPGRSFASCCSLISHFKNHHARKDVFPPCMWIPRQSFASTEFPTPLSAATNLHMAHIWAFIQEHSWYWGGYLMRRKSGRPFSFAVWPSRCWQRGGLRTKSVSDPTELKSSQYTHTHTQVFLCYFPAWKAFVASCSTNCNKRRRLYHRLIILKVKRTASRTTRESRLTKIKETDAHIHTPTQTKNHL